MSNPPGISAVGQVHINVENIERATGFYRDVLGLDYLFTAGNMAFVMCGDVRLMLSVAEEPEHAHPSSILYFTVADLSAAHTALRARGVHFEQEPLRVHRADDHDLWMAFFRDSEANVMALISEAPRGAD
jgi:methylmalonyl-CoA/ethylmalonyl-CoA epimerase